MNGTRPLGLTGPALVMAVCAPATAGAAPGSAPEPACGAVVTTDVTLTEDLLDCPGDGLVVGASGITIDLAGHSLTGSGVFTSRSGIDNEEHDGVTVLGGSISGFAAGVRAYRATDGVVRDLQVSSALEGVSLDGTSGFEVVGNRFTNHRTGVRLRGAVDTRVHHNSVRRSTATGMSEVRSATVRDSAFSRNGLDGLRVDGESLGLHVRRVDASRNGDSGIVLSSTAPTVSATSADHNGRDGIRAPDDTVDGGGNTARRNGESDCLGVTCR
jgi:hypothetical protein